MIDRWATSALGIWIWLAGTRAPDFAGARAMEAGSAIERPYHVSHWTPANGLPQNSVKALARTGDGYLWIGTLNGLARFDGVRFKVFDHRNTPVMTHDSVNDLAVDSADGGLWISTGNGLLSYRRHHFESYGAKDGIPDSAGVLSPSSEGGVWFCPGAGRVGLARNGRVTLWTFGADSEANGVRQLFEEGPSRLLLILGNGHILHQLDLRTGSLHPLKVPNEKIPCHSFWRDPSGALWICAGDGIWRGWENNWTRMTRLAAGSSSEPARVYQTRDGQVWATQFEGGRISLQRLEGDQLQPFGDPGFPISVSLGAVLEGREGDLWVGTMAGLFRLAPSWLKTYSSRDGMRNDEVLSVAAGDDNTVWVGTAYGIHGIREGLLLDPSPPPGLEWNRAGVIFVDRRSAVWTGWPDPPSLRSLDGGVWQTRLTAPAGSPPIGSCRALYQDRAGRTWVATGQGVACWEGDRWQCFSTTNGLSCGDVRVIYQDRQGSLWFGTFGGGLNRLRAGTFTSYRTDRGDHNNRAWWIHEDVDGVFWVGSEDGLNRFVPPGPDDSSGAGTVRVGADPNASQRSGPRTTGEERFFSFTTQQGLQENVVNNVQEDDDGFLWLSGLHGIYRISRNRLNEVAAGRRAEVECMTFGEADGMLSSECNGGDNQPAGCKDPRGRIWFPTAQGLVMIDPKLAPATGVPPPVVIEQVRANRRIVFGDDEGNSLANSALSGAGSEGAAPRAASSPSEVLRFAAGKGRALEIRYTATSFAAPDRVRFKYRLEGYERDWVFDDQNRRVAFYTNLRPGAYSFHVSACDSHGCWNQADARFSFFVAPYFWETWPFYLLAGALVLTAALGLHEGRIRRMRAIERLEQDRALAEERTRIARDLHDQLGSDLTRIALEGELAARSCQNCVGAAVATVPGGLSDAASNAEREPDAARSTFMRIQALSVSVRDAFRSLDEMIWAVNPKQDTVAGLANYLCQFTAGYLRSAGIRCRFDVPAGLPSLPLRASVRHELFLVIKEGLHNTVKHAGACEVHLRVRATEDRMEIQLSDDGRGFDGATADTALPAPASAAPLHRTRNGLANMRERVAVFGGRLEISSAPGQGTRLSILAPIKPRAR